MTLFVFHAAPVWHCWAGKDLERPQGFNICCSTSFRRWQEFVVTELAPTHHSKENSQRSFTTHRFTVILSALSSLSDTHIISTKTFTFRGRHPAESYGKQEHIYFHIACLCKCMLTNTYCVHNSFALCPVALPHCCTVEVKSM
uniref:Uncharacterized protein n=1 Tax=Oryzias latipes TaxID=8090 RepID=A0A3P9MML8_ORYLA